ncbi:uncharacterized protein LOC112847531 [Oreochromis niloticus]|uniref:uncharacterized protein LOC112847531 n=1 Tax=Oreochromis niloticus TaxID=8128 RepID=UPI000DF24F90|nr:uncharacterized protein LOC112847531 [Oreochromis niloticus]
MLNISAKDKGLYRDRLCPDAKRRYLEKIACIGNVDPYEIRKWSGNPDDLPPLSYPDIFAYLVCGVSAYTANQFKNYKSLEAHIQFTNSWVHDLSVYKPPRSEYVVVKTKVLHSQRMNETALQPWVIVSTNGRVEAAHCTCMAGVAETCTHVAALLFKVEATVRIRGTRTVTDEPAYWVLPGNMTRIQPEVAHSIDFSSAAAQKRELDEIINTPSASRGKRRRSQKRHIPIATLEDLPPLLDTLQKHSKAVTLCGVENYYTNYTTQSPTLPQSLACLHNRDAESLGLPDLQVHCLKFLTAAGVTEAQAEEIEAQTRSQHMTPAWFRWRAGRITASAMHAVLATSLDTPAHSVVNRVCYPEKTFSTVQTRWGVEHEEDARKAYKEIMASHHRNLQVRLCGFCVNNFPEVGASPDGLTICDCCGKGCLEIKCPFKQRMASIKEALAAQDKDFCLEVAANGLQLKQAHPYYCQVQTQIFVTGANHCDLVVWTQRDLAVIRIFPAVDFWKPRLKQAQDFFLKVCLPELVGKYFSKQRAALSSL